jgi:hypothetical protein
VEIAEGEANCIWGFMIKNIKESEKIIKKRKKGTRRLNFWFGAVATKYENITSIPPT